MLSAMDAVKRKEQEGARATRPTFQNSNTGGFLSVTFTAHIDSAFAFNPIGAVIHLFRDVFGSKSRHPCP